MDYLEREDDHRPLLVSPFESSRRQKGSDEEAYMDYKWSKPMSLKARVRSAGKVGRGRARTMAMGAASIINKWPDHLLLCWLGSIAFMVIGAGFIMMMVTLARRTSMSSLNYQEQCLLRDLHDSRKDTTAMTTNVFLHVLVNNHEMFDPSKFKTALTTTVRDHPSFILNVFVLFNDLSDGNYRRNARFKNWESYHKGINNHEFFDTPSSEIDSNTDVTLLDSFANKNIKIIQSSFSNYFKHSPLRNDWRSIPHTIMPLVMRVMTVWEHGGISLPIQMFLDKTTNHLTRRYGNSALRELVAELKRNFSQIALNPMEETKKKEEALKTFKHDLQGMSVERGFNLDEIKAAFRNLKTADPTAGTFAQAIARAYDSHSDPISPEADNDDDESYDDESEPEPSTLSSSSVVDSKALFASALNKVPDHGHSSRYESSEYESSYEYYDSSSDGLPSSIESFSRSDELRIKTEFPNINDQIMRFVNGKMDNETMKKRLEEVERRSRIRRALYSISSSESDEDYLSMDFELMEPQKPLLSTLKYDDSSSESTLDLTVRRTNKPLQHQAVLPKSTLDFQDDYTSLEKKPLDSFESDSVSYLSVSNSYSWSSEWNSGSDSTQSLYKKFNPISDMTDEPSVKVRENKDYKKMQFYQDLNIFSLPIKETVTLDEAGYYISTRKPCHAFLGQLISILQKKSNFRNADELISVGLKTFCRDRKYSECSGLALL